MAGPITVAILGDNRKLNTAIGQSESRLGKFGGMAGKVGKAVALGLVAGAAGAVVLGKKLIDAGERMGTSNARIQQVNKSMGLFGKETDAVSGRLIKLAESTARQTGIDQNSIKMTQAKLLTFKNLATSADKAGGMFDRANQAALDMAAAGFGSAESNAVGLGKALNDPIKGITALNRQGVTFTETERKKITALVESGRAAKAQEMIMGALETQVGGTAKATANGTDRIKVAFSQLAEKGGAKLTPFVDKFANLLIDKALPALMKLGPPIRDLAQKIGAQLGPVLAGAAALFRKVAPIVLDLAKKIGGNLKPVAVQLAKTFRADILPAAQKIIPVIVKFAGKVLELASAIIGRVLPVAIKLAGFIIRSLVPAVVGIVSAATKAIGGLIRFGKAIADGVAAVGRFAGAVRDKIGDAVNYVQGLPGKITGALSGAGTLLLNTGRNIIEGFLSGIRSAAGSIVSTIQSYVIDKIPGPIKKALGIASPSRVTERIGKQVSEGLIVGMRKKGKDVQKAAQKLAQKLRDSIKTFAAEIKGNAISFGSILAGVDGDVLSADTIQQSMLERLEAMRAFQANVAALKAQGLNKRTLREILAGGVESGGATAAALVEGGKDAIKGVNSLAGQIAAAAAKLGDTGSRAVHDEMKKRVKRDAPRIAARDIRGASRPQLTERARREAQGRRQVTVKLTAEQLSRLQRGKEIRMDLDAYEREGGHK